jgi:hypothetical protein
MNPNFIPSSPLIRCRRLFFGTEILRQGDNLFQWLFHSRNSSPVLHFCAQKMILEATLMKKLFSMLLAAALAVSMTSTVAMASIRVTQKTYPVVTTEPEKEDRDRDEQEFYPDEPVTVVNTITPALTSLSVPQYVWVNQNRSPATGR